MAQKRLKNSHKIDHITLYPLSPLPTPWVTLTPKTVCQKLPHLQPSCCMTTRLKIRVNFNGELLNRLAKWRGRFTAFAVPPVIYINPISSLSGFLMS